MERSWCRTCSYCGRVIPTVVLAATLALLIAPTPASAQLNLPLKNIAHWSNEFGAIISGVVSRASGEVDIRAEYVLPGPELENVNGHRVVMDMKKKMEDMLQMKVDALSSLVDVAEEAHARHDDDDHIKLSYPKAKKLNTSEFLLEEDEHFNYIPVNLSMSTVHVPTNVYDESSEVLNGVDWSEALDEHFQRNYENDPTLTWQYFGSATGFFRNYPGAEWQTEIYRKHHIDTYDCRSRRWYIQAATSPKDIVILLDRSGSMKGLRMAIAKATVKKIMETLSDDDFFNVIKFSKDPEYVDPCFNGTLVQANADIKKKITEALENVNTSGIAYFDKALEEAFELLIQVNQSGKGAQCNRAIMLITDGAPETHEDIFKRYNWPEKNIRVFTYLIGREVGDSRQVTWMACNNKGVFSHISTLADVHEHVQEYINVISRPMVIDRANHTIWTSVYVDAAHDSELNTDCSHCTGLQLMTSVAAPVYDTRNDTSGKGILLGVMGTDVPLKELTKLTAKYKLGVNGYAFAITNNGYVLFHPDFRPTKGALIKPNYNSVDLAEVELSMDVQNATFESGIATPHYDTELRKRMVDRDTGNLVMKVKVHYDNMKRIAIRNQHYFFTSINGTPFSLGIALPAGYGLYTVNGRIRLDQNAQLDAFAASKIKVADWNYCDMDTNETRQDRALMLRKYMEYGKQDSPLYDKCDNDLIESILFDAIATRGALASWLKQNRDGTLNQSTSRSNCPQGEECYEDSEAARNGIELVFLGTKGGLTRYLELAENLTDPYFIDNNTNTIEEMYYVHAVEGGDKVFTFSIPFDAAERFPDLVVTAATPVVHTEHNQETIPMVIGLQMKYGHFYEFFMNSTMLCPETDTTKCNLTCYSDELDCYLLDNNAYIVLSEDPNKLGEFFGSIDAPLMEKLLYDENIPEMSRGVFQMVQMYDFQGVCEQTERDGSGAASIFMNPLLQLVKIFWGMLYKFAWLLLQFNIFTTWPSSIWAASANDLDYQSYQTGSAPVSYASEASMTDDLYYQGLDDGSIEECFLEVFGQRDERISRRLAMDWRNQLFAKNIDYKDCDAVRHYFISKQNKYLRQIVKEDQPCVLEHSVFLAKSENLPHYDDMNCQSCSRSYSINRVVGTNLMLLVVDNVCPCDVTPIKLQPQEVTYEDYEMCQRLQTEIYRKRPSACYASHENETTSDQCDSGGGNAMPVPSSGTLLLVISLSLLFVVTDH